MGTKKFFYNDTGDTLILYRGSADTVRVKPGVIALGDFAFFMTKVHEVILPEGLKLIGNQCFWDSIFISEMTLPDTLEEIGREAFRTCKLLHTLTLPRSLKKIGIGAFYNSGIRQVYYEGSRSDWEKVELEDGEIETPNGIISVSNAEFLDGIIDFAGD